MGRHLSLLYGQVILVSGYLFDSRQLITTLVSNQFSPGLTNKLESSVCLWYGWTGGRTAPDYQIFSDG